MRYRERHPAVELSDHHGRAGRRAPRLQAGDLDMALSHDPDWSSTAPGLEIVHLFDDPMYIALPADHRLAHVAPLALADFADEPWMLSMPATCADARMFQRACLEAGFTPRVALENDDYTAMLGFVAAGMGVSLVPEMVTRVVRSEVVIRELRSEVVIRELQPALPPRPIVAALAADYRSAAAAAMVTCCTTSGGSGSRQWCRRPSEIRPERAQRSRAGRPHRAVLAAPFRRSPEPSKSYLCARI